MVAVLFGELQPSYGWSFEYQPYITRVCNTRHYSWGTFSMQYVVTGVWKGNSVAIRVTKQDILDGAGLLFLGDAITILK